MSSPLSLFQTLFLKHNVAHTKNARNELARLAMGNGNHFSSSRHFNACHLQIGIVGTYMQLFYLTRAIGQDIFSLH